MRVHSYLVGLVSESTLERRHRCRRRRVIITFFAYISALAALNNQ